MNSNHIRLHLDRPAISSAVDLIKAQCAMKWPPPLDIWMVQVIVGPRVAQLNADLMRDSEDLELSVDDRAYAAQQLALVQDCERRLANLRVQVRNA
jgi:hypothetical protein